MPEQQARKQPGLWFALALLVIILDQVSKYWITGHFSLYEQLALIPGYFNLTLAYNKGAAWSFLANAGGWQRHFFTVLALLVSAGIVWLILKNTQQKLFCLALSLILGGALGNVIDRILLGHVVDFIQVHYYEQWYFPAFNVADSGICVGVALMFLDSLFNSQKNKES